MIFCFDRIEDNLYLSKQAICILGHRTNKVEIFHSIMNFELTVFVDLEVINGINQKQFAYFGLPLISLF